MSGGKVRSDRLSNCANCTTAALQTKEPLHVMYDVLLINVKSQYNLRLHSVSGI